MKMTQRLRRRFGRNNMEVDITDEALALALQLGWIEKCLGKYILTERGADEMLLSLKKSKC